MTNDTMTLEQLMSLFPDYTAKKDRHDKASSPDEAICRYETEDCQLLVYPDGYFTYRAGRNRTTLPIKHVLDPIRYTYANGDQLALGYDYFKDKPFALRFILEGERRLALNRKIREQRRVLLLPPSAINDLSGKITPIDDFVEQEAQKEEWEQALQAIQSLSEKEQQVIASCVMEARSQQETARKMSTSRQNIHRRLHRAIRQVQQKISA